MNTNLEPARERPASAHKSSRETVIQWAQQHPQAWRLGLACWYTGVLCWGLLWLVRMEWLRNQVLLCLTTVAVGALIDWQAVRRGARHPENFSLHLGVVLLLKPLFYFPAIAWWPKRGFNAPSGVDRMVASQLMWSFGPVLLLALLGGILVVAHILKTGPRGSRHADGGLRV